MPPVHEVLAELERLLESRWLRESHQLKKLLRHIVNETLAGRGDGLKEYSLGLEVFHRSGDYDPRRDAIVRVQASQLRKKIQSYYEHEGSDSLMHIDIPRGAYVPLIERRLTVLPGMAAMASAPISATRGINMETTSTDDCSIARW